MSDKEQPGRDPVKSGDKWKLTRSQRKNLLRWIGENLTPGEINKRAALSREPFKMSRQAIGYYRKQTGQKIEAARRRDDKAAYNKGFAVRDKRLGALDNIARLLYEDLTGPGKTGLWLDDAKALGTGEFMTIYGFKRFNREEIEALRGTFDDIAKEVGDRPGGGAKRIGIELGAGEGGEGEGAATYKFYIGLDPDKV